MTATTGPRATGANATRFAEAGSAPGRPGAHSDRHRRGSPTIFVARPPGRPPTRLATRSHAGFVKLNPTPDKKSTCFI